MVLSAAQITHAPKAQQATLVLTSSLQTRWAANLGAGERLVFCLLHPYQQQVMVACS